MDALRRAGRHLSARELTLRLVKGRWHGRYGTATCPAHADRNPSLTIRDGDRAPLLKCKAGCTQNVIIRALRTEGLWPGHGGDAVPWTPPVSPGPGPIPISEGVARIWRETIPAPGTLVDLWLKGRGLKWAIPPAIRFHPRLAYYDEMKLIGSWPAMVVRLEDDAGELVGIHRTWLDPDAVGKAPLPAGMPARKTLGRQGVAWLGRRDTTALIVAEGVESALAGSELGDESFASWGATPVSLISANGFKNFTVPATTRHLFICEDNDPAGIRETKELAKRFASSSLKVTILSFEETR